MTEIAFADRNRFEIFNWPELAAAFVPLAKLCLGEGHLTRQIKQEAFTLLSLGSGCQHCQAHGGYGLYLAGVPTERIQALWNFDRSELFTEKSGRSIISHWQPDPPHLP